MNELTGTQAVMGILSAAFFITGAVALYVYFNGNRLMKEWRKMNPHRFVEAMEKQEFFDKHRGIGINLLLVGLGFLIIALSV